MQDTVWLTDTTLRDGEQAPGVVFTLNQKTRIARMLADAGIDELEAGYPALGEEEQKSIRKIQDLNLSCRITSWCRAQKKDIEAACMCHTPGVHIGFPVSPMMMNAMGRDENWVMDQLEELLLYAAQYFDFIHVGAQDATRADPIFLEQFVVRAQACGARRIRLSDTVGIATPVAVERLIRRLIDPAGAMGIEFNAHNDLGMATANAVTAVAAGAQAITAAVNGLGERAGHTRLEEVASALWVAEGKKCRVRTIDLMPICAYVAKAARRPIPSDKPITGSMAFVKGTAPVSRTGQPAPKPALLSKKSRFKIGKYARPELIREIFKKTGILIDRPEAAVLLDHVRRTARKKGGSLSAAELIHLYNMTRDRKKPKSPA